MLTAYIAAAMRHARYEQLPDDGTYYGEIPGFPGVWANNDTIEATQVELQEVLEGWIVFGLANHRPLPAVDGIEPAVPGLA